MAQDREHVRPAPLKPSPSGRPAAPATASGRSVVIRSGADIAEVSVSEARMKWIAAGEGVLGKLIAGYADTAAKAQQTGRSFLLTYEVTPDGQARTISEAPADGSIDGPLDAAIARARARGATKITDVLRSADMLTARDFGPLIGASHETVNVMRRRDELLGLEGATRGIRYPRWQVTDAGLPLPGLARLFGILGRQPWTVFRFLLAEHAELGGQTALDALKAGQVDAVASVADNLVVGAFS